MKDHYLTQLRDANLSMVKFRENAQKLIQLLAAEAARFLPLKPTRVQTPFSETAGQTLPKAPILIAILRSGLAMLPPFLKLFPDAPIGFFGMRRDEKTLQPHLYYENLPLLHPDDNVFLLDPIVATGGSSALALQKICAAGVRPEKIVFASILASKQGASLLDQRFPQVRRCCAAVDERLNPQGYIVPGLGDFGDRFFGT